MALVGERPARAPAEYEEVSRTDAARWEMLARRIAAGDPDSEAELATIFYPRVKVFTSVRLHGSDAASDIAQDTILAVIEALRAGRLQAPFNLSGFVLGTARNLVNNHHRKAARNPEIQGGMPDRPADQEPHWADLDVERWSLVRKALQRLNALDRRILRLTLVEGMHPREIAPMVGLNADIVRTRKSRAVKAIAESVEGMTRMRGPGHIEVSGPKQGGAA